MVRSIVVAICTVFLFAACISQEPIDTNRVAIHKEKLEKCSDAGICIGGFIKFNDDMRIYRIVNDCGPMACAPYTTGLVHLLFFDEKVLNHIESIDLPNDKTWNLTAAAHARQFVQH